MATVSDPLGRPGPDVESDSSRTSMTGWVPANPAPLGLSGFGITTLVLSLINSNLVGAGATPVVLGLAFAYGGLAQLLAGMWEFRTGNTFGAVAFSSFGAFWISYFILVTYDAKLITPGEINAALGAYLWVWGVFTAMIFLCTLRSPHAIQLLFLLLTVTFVLLGIGNAGGHSNVVHAGGYVGIATAAVALYTACAEIMKAQHGHWVLPVGEPRPPRG
jgi:succinate-acetate transporter protein